MDIWPLYSPPPLELRTVGEFFTTRFISSTSRAGDSCGRSKPLSRSPRSLTCPTAPNLQKGARFFPHPGAGHRSTAAAPRCAANLTKHSQWQACQSTILLLQRHCHISSHRSPALNGCPQITHPLRRATSACGQTSREYSRPPRHSLAVTARHGARV